MIGQGNVALDVARILLKNPKELDDTDLPTPVLDVLHSSAVEKVSVVGRRGPGQVAFTTKELREMTNLSGVSFDGIQGDLMEKAKKEAEKDRVRKRLLGLMEKPSGSGAGGGRGKTFELDFLKSPKQFTPSPNDPTSVGGVEYEINALLPSPATPLSPTTGTGMGTEATPVPMVQSAGAKAIPTGETVTREADMIVESVGYRSEGLESESVPFDVGRGRVRNVGGRVTYEDGSIVCPPPRYQCSFCLSPLSAEAGVGADVAGPGYLRSRMGSKGSGGSDSIHNDRRFRTRRDYHC